VALIDQLGGQGLVLTAGVIADDANRAGGVGGEHLLVQPLGALRVNAVGLVEVDSAGALGGESHVDVYPFANGDREQRLFPARFGLHVGGPRVVGGVGRIGKIDHRFLSFGVG